VSIHSNKKATNRAANPAYPAQYTTEPPHPFSEIEPHKLI
jgi:hypothetical protein